MRRLITALIVGLVLCIISLATRVLAQSSFQGLGHLGGGTSSAADISGDGLVVVGTSHNGQEDEAFRWTAATGMLGLGTPAGGSSAANAVSADGSVIVGRFNNGTNDEAFRWTAAGGLQGLGVLDQGRSEAFGVSADGSVIVGIAGREAENCGFLIMKPCPPPAGTEQGFRWTQTTGMVGVGTLPVAGQNGTIARGISADGSVIVGDAFGYLLFCFPEHGGGCVYFKSPTHAFRWSSATGIQDIAGNASNSVANSISGDGVHIVGSAGALGAARWTASEGFISLGLANATPVANDVSFDGSVIVGGGGQGLAFIWRSQAAYLKPVLMMLYGLNLTGWTLTEATGISSDGRTIVGNGVNPGGKSEAWIASLDSLPDPAALASLPSLVSGRLLAGTLPQSRSGQVGTPLTAFSTILNTGSSDAVSCRIAPATPIPAQFDYGTTDPVTNQVTGTPNTPVDIPAGAFQSFVFAFTPTQPFQSTEVALIFDCANTGSPVPSLVGVNTILLSASPMPVPDVVALAATLPSAFPGTVNIPGATGTGVFSIGAVNVGASGTITASADTGAATLPVSITICQTNPVTGDCLEEPSASVTTQIGSGETPTFAVFAKGSGIVVFDPGAKRIHVRFKDSDGITRGSTSVALQTVPDV